MPDSPINPSSSMSMDDTTLVEGTPLSVDTAASGKKVVSNEDDRHSPSPFDDDSHKMINRLVRNWHKSQSSNAADQLPLDLQRQFWEALLQDLRFIGRKLETTIAHSETKLGVNHHRQETAKANLGRVRREIKKTK